MSGSMAVLFVDDDGEFAAMAASMLESADGRLSVETATDAAAAIDHLGEHPIDCIVSDHDMPGQNGIEFLKRVRETDPHLPFILFTAKGSEAVASDAISAGVTDYLQKEVGTEQYELLANRIVDAIDHYRARTTYREIFEKVPDGIVVHDPADGAFVDMNSRYVEMFGYDSRDEFLEAGFEAIHVGEEPYTYETARERVSAALERGPVSFEWPALTKQGDRFWAEVHLTPVVLYGRDRLLAVVRDITERKDYERELEATNERLDAFTRTVSHDLRNPLSVAEGRLELARAECECAHLDDVERALERIDTLIDSVLAESRRGETALELEPVNLPTAVERSWEYVSADSATLEVVTDRTVRADRSHLRQLLENVLQNAIHYGGPEVTVRVVGLAEGFAIVDDGPGIDPDNAESVFEVGYTTNSEGTGLGLNIVRTVAELHGWSVELAESDDGGARFEVTGVDIVE